VGAVANNLGNKTNIAPGGTDALKKHMCDGIQHKGDTVESCPLFLSSTY